MWAVFAACIVLSHQPSFWHQKHSLQIPSYLGTGILWCLRNSSPMLGSFVPLSKSWMIFPALNYTSLLWRVNNNTPLHFIGSLGWPKRASMSLLSFTLLRAQDRNLVIDPIRTSFKENLVTGAVSRFQEVAKFSLGFHQEYVWQVGHPRCQPHGIRHIKEGTCHLCSIPEPGKRVRLNI